MLQPDWQSDCALTAANGEIAKCFSFFQSSEENFNAMIINFLRRLKEGHNLQFLDLKIKT